MSSPTEGGFLHMCISSTFFFSFFLFLSAETPGIWQQVARLANASRQVRGAGGSKKDGKEGMIGNDKPGK